MELARKRAVKVGFVHAPSDKQFAAHLRSAGRHASKAMTLAERARRSRRIGRTTVVVVTGAGAVGGAAAYAGWKALGQQSIAATSSDEANAQPSAESAPPAP
jgi:hypothetical protein